MKLRLKGIVQDCDFRFNELSVYEKFRKTKSFQGDPGLTEAYLFISKGETQLLWVLRYENDMWWDQHKYLAAVPKGKEPRLKRRRIQSLKLRVSGGRWHPLMLANYANEVGIDLDGIKKFEEVYDSRHPLKVA